MLTLDTNNILSIGPITNTGKEYTRTFYGYPFSNYDHTVLVYHKGEVLEKQWKDIGAGQCVLQICRRHPERSEGSHDKPFNTGLARIGFDILYKYDNERGEAINIAKIDADMVAFANHTFGTSKNALIMPSYDICLTENAIVSFLFGIAVAHGKWTIKNEELYPVKITLPLTSSLLGQKNFFEKMTMALHAAHIIHTVQYIQTGTYEVIQITLHDPMILSQFAQWLNPIVKIAKISTFDFAQKVYKALNTYASEQGLELPITSASELIVLQAD